MKKLWEDIYEFLGANGFECTRTEVCGISILYVPITGKGIRAVLPLEISARTMEEARIKAAVAEECIKTIEADGYGRPIVITQDRWHYQSQMTKARLLAHLEIFDHIYARNCEVRKIEKSTAAEFLNANHSYGDAVCRYRYGLYLKRHTGHIAAEGKERAKYPSGTLAAVATFSNARKWIKGDKSIRSYEWTRYASLPGVRISGGMGKLLKAFIKEVGPDDIMTYADLEWSEGKVYERLGFTLESIKAPVTFDLIHLNIIKDTRLTAVDMPPTARGRERLSKWSCGPLQRAATEGRARINGSNLLSLYFQNFGSNKYRLKLTDYQ